MALNQKKSIWQHAIWSDPHLQRGKESESESQNKSDEEDGLSSPFPALFFALSAFFFFCFSFLRFCGRRDCIFRCRITLCNWFLNILTQDAHNQFSQYLGPSRGTGPFHNRFERFHAQCKAILLFNFLCLSIWACRCLSTLICRIPSEQHLRVSVLTLLLDPLTVLKIKDDTYNSPHQRTTTHPSNTLATPARRHIATQRNPDQR